MLRSGSRDGRRGLTEHRVLLWNISKFDRNIERLHTEEDILEDNRLLGEAEEIAIICFVR